jgi:DNA-binding MarR family transcriptional regulator
VSRRRDPDDGRAVLISLTREGGAVTRSRHANRMAKLSRLVDRLTPDERDVLAGSAAVLARLIEIAATDDSD